MRHVSTTFSVFSVLAGCAGLARMVSRLARNPAVVAAGVLLSWAPPQSAYALIVWFPPKPIAAVSDDTLTLVRIVPSSLTPTTPSDVIPHATPPRAERYRLDSGAGRYELVQKFDLVDQFRPTEAYVANDGTLLTIGEYYSGYTGNDSPVLVLYRSDGSVLARPTFAELFSKSDAECFGFLPEVGYPWRGSKAPEFGAGEVVITDGRGAQLTFDLGSGKLRSRSNPVRCPSAEREAMFKEMRERRERESE